MENPQRGRVALSKEPIAVEESRAQRLQRQQSRFRDRGGIFVPSNRNTLIDILLGRKAASPKQARARSASLSPRKAGAKRSVGEQGTDGSPKPLRTSPRKAAQRRAEEEGTIAGPSRLPADVTAHKVPKTSKKPAKKSTSSTGTTTTTTATASKRGKGKVKPAGTEEPAPKRRGRPSKSKLSNLDDCEPTIDVPEENEQHPKPRLKGGTKPPGKRAIKKAKSAAIAELPVDEGLPAVAKAQGEPKGTKKRAAKKATASPVGNMGDVGRANDASQKLDSSGDALSKQSLAKSKGTILDLSGDGADDERVMPDRLGKPKMSQVEDDNLVPTLARKKGSRADRDSAKKKGKGTACQIVVEDNKSSATASSKKKTRSLQGNDEALAPEDAGPARATKKRNRAEPEAGSEAHKTKRARVVSPEEDEPRPRGRTKTEARPQAADRKGGALVNKATADVPVSPVSKKRSREPDKDGVTRGKRAKVSGNVHDEAGMAVSREADEEHGKAKEALEKTGRAQDPAPSRNTDAKKTSSNSKPVPVPKLRPRKSVLQRIKKPLPEIEDDDPDPINFLS